MSSGMPLGAMPPWSNQNAVGYVPGQVHTLYHSPTQLTQSSSQTSFPPLSSTITAQPSITDYKPFPTSNDKDYEPSRYIGYPGFSAWMASDNDFFVIRKFGNLSARAILKLQDEISRLSEALDEEDEQCRKTGDHTGQLRDDPSPSRQSLLEQIIVKLEVYNRFIQSHSQLKARPKATRHQINNVNQWFRNNTDAIQMLETKFMENEDDLMTLEPKAHVPLKRFVAKFNFIRNIPWLQEAMKPNQAETTVYNKEARIDKIITFLTISAGLCMLIGPLWWLQQITVSTAKQNIEYRLGVITGFVVLFTVLLGSITVAKPFEVLGATAAYSAVLMVFMQISQPQIDGSTAGTR